MVIFVHTLALNCNVSNIVLEILKHDEIWGTVCISILHSKFWGDLSLLTPVICAPVPVSVDVQHPKTCSCSVTVFAAEVIVDLISLNCKWIENCHSHDFFTWMCLIVTVDLVLYLWTLGAIEMWSLSF